MENVWVQIAWFACALALWVMVARRRIGRQSGLWRLGAIAAWLVIFFAATMIVSHWLPGEAGNRRSNGPAAPRPTPAPDSHRSVV